MMFAIISLSLVVQEQSFQPGARLPIDLFGVGWIQETGIASCGIARQGVDKINCPRNRSEA